MTLRIALQTISGEGFEDIIANAIRVAKLLDVMVTVDVNKVPMTFTRTSDPNESLELLKKALSRKREVEKQEAKRLAALLRGA